MIIYFFYGFILLVFLALFQFFLLKFFMKFHIKKYYKRKDKWSNLLTNDEKNELARFENVLKKNYKNFNYYETINTVFFLHKKLDDFVFLIENFNSGSYEKTLQS